MQIHSVTPNACGLKAGLRTTLLIISGSRHMNGSLENNFQRTARTRTIGGIKKFPNRFWVDGGFPRQSG
jgi:hypothetical protein